MNKRIAADTNALVRYLGYDMRNSSLVSSSQATKIFDDIFRGEGNLFVSVISLVEIWAKLSHTPEAKLKFQVANKLLESQFNVRIVEMDFDILKRYSAIQNVPDIKEYDRIVVATAMEFQCDTLITSDGIIHANESYLGGIKLVHS